jgi:hypothetical protein
VTQPPTPPSEQALLQLSEKEEKQEQTAVQKQELQPATKQQTTQVQSSETQTLQAQSSELLFRLANSTPQDIDRFLNNLRNVLGEVRQALATTGQQDAPDVARVLQEARSLESHIDFTSQIRNQLFVQLPLYYEGQQSLASLFVHKDAKKSGKSSIGGASSALIALETSSMGHFENDEIVQTVRNNIHKLDALLRESGYSLEHFSFLPPDEPYSLINRPTEAAAVPIDEIFRFDKKV